MDALTSAASGLLKTLEDVLWPRDPATRPTTPKAGKSARSAIESNEFLADILSKEGLLNAVKDFQRDASSFVRAIDWSEPFIAALVAFHISFFLWILATRKDTNVTMYNLVTLALLALSSEQINSFASQNHASIARTNYFDKNGVFITTMFSTPILFLMVVTVVILLVQLSRALVKAKRMQLQAQAKAAGKAAASSK